MTRAERNRRVLARMATIGIWVYALTFLVVTGRPILMNHYLEKRSIDEFIVYHGDKVFPPVARVFYGTPVRFVSDMQILDVPPGGFTVIWEETLYCDNNPHDSFTGPSYLDYEAPVATTSQRYTKPTSRKTEIQLKASKGWPVRIKREDYHPVDRQTPMVRYPEHDADCPIKSILTLRFPSGHEKTMTIWSVPTQVRGLIGDAYAP